MNKPSKPELIQHRVEKRWSYYLSKYKCGCGNTFVAQPSKVNSGKAVSCGCYASRNRLKTHGLYNTRINTIWGSMKNRCHNSNNHQFKYYGGKGVTVCEEWRISFLSFYNWAMSAGYKDNLSIDRIDSNGNYEPSNCRWATASEQACNTRRNIHIEYNGQTKTFYQWAAYLRVPKTTFEFWYKKKNYSMDTIVEKSTRYSTAGAFLIGSGVLK